MSALDVRTAERRLERFTALWEPDEYGRCWEWQGRIEENGYGRFYWGPDRGAVWAHRASWEMRVGPIPDGFEVCHSCDNRRCIRPSHLFLGTRADNMADARSKGRTTQGERAPRAKLRTSDVLAIRSSAEGPRSLGRRYGVSESLIRGIRSGRRWAHVRP